MLVIHLPKTKEHLLFTNQQKKQTITKVARTVHTNANLFFIKRKKKIGKYTAKFTFLWYDNFGENQTPLQRNGMAAIPKKP